MMKTKKAQKRQVREGERQSLTLGRAESLVEKRLIAMQRDRIVHRLWSKEASIWKQEHEQSIKNRLGWLESPRKMLDRVREIDAFVEEVKNAGFTHALLLGMGGSSLCPEVCRETFGVKRGFLDLAVLDSTDPAAVVSMESRADSRKTLFIVSSKSGTTTESNSFFNYFFAKVRAHKAERAGENFIAITDAGTPLEQLARRERFRRVFLNPADIGGRYSAFSYFGLVPARLIGINIEKLLERTVGMLEASAASAPVAENPAAVLGATMGELAKRGRDKLTFVVSSRIRTFGSWVEQLVAESTGKEGVGIIPVVDEPLDGVGVYGKDRLFVSLELGKSMKERRQLARLKKAGYPTVSIRLADPYDLGQEFFRWEFATSIAGSILGIDPFDEPNVKESKDNTNRILKEYRETGNLEVRQPRQVGVESGELKLYVDQGLFTPMPSSSGTDLVVKYLSSLLGLVEAGEYVAILAYLHRTSLHERILQQVRVLLRDSLRVATTVGFGPRFLHSTGQLHKGGPNKGVFIQITADDANDLAIPGEPYSFGILKRAQASGDYQALVDKKRRVVNIHLRENVRVGLLAFRDEVKKSLKLLRPAPAGSPPKPQ